MNCVEFQHRVMKVERCDRDGVINSRRMYFLLPIFCTKRGTLALLYTEYITKFNDNIFQLFSNPIPWKTKTDEC